MTLQCEERIYDYQTGVKTRSNVRHNGVDPKSVTEFTYLEYVVNERFKDTTGTWDL